MEDEISMEDAISMEVHKWESSAPSDGGYTTIFKAENDFEYIKCSRGIVIARPFPKSFEKELQESWPAVESAIEKWGLTCNLNLSNSFIIFKGTHHTVGNGFINARVVLALLSAAVPAHRAARVLMDEVPCDIIRTGHHRYGICTESGIKKDEYQKRKELLMTLPEKELAALTGCEIYFRPKNDLVAAIGPKIGLKLARRIVTDCIVHKVPPARRIKYLLNRDQVSRRLEKLSLG